MNMINNYMNKENLEEHAQQQIEDAARDDEGLEADRVAEFENTRGTDKPSKYFNN